MNSVFFDSNVLIYALIEGESRQTAASRLLATGGTVSVQVLNEFATVAHRKLKLSWPEAETALAALRTLCAAPLPLTLTTHEAALALASRYGFAFYDALIVASALEAGCPTLFSEDMQDGQVIEGRLTIRNPFRQV